MGLDVYLYHYEDFAKVKDSLDGMEEDPGEHINQDSQEFPEHYFKIGYFRSSYNSGGLNSILNDAIKKDLYWIFQTSQDYYVQPDWKSSRRRAVQVLEEFINWEKRFSNVGISEIPLGRINTQTVGSKQDALRIFEDHQQKGAKQLW
jgi:hypothetical protein